jgi:hypothetical protein
VRLNWIDRDDRRAGRDMEATRTVVVVRISSMMYEFDEPYLKVRVSWSPYGHRMRSECLETLSCDTE